MSAEAIERPDFVANLKFPDDIVQHMIERYPAMFARVAGKHLSEYQRVDMGIAA